ncbi:MAG: DUF1491 family protein [Sphingomonadaceae bacterium]
MVARLTSAIIVTSLTRRAFLLGGSAAILVKGDQAAGDIMIIMREKGLVSGLWERALAPSGDYLWMRNEQQDIEKKYVFAQYLDRRRARDPDLWVIELDVPNAERFTADINEMN